MTVLSPPFKSDLSSPIINLCYCYYYYPHLPFTFRLNKLTLNKLALLLRDTHHGNHYPTITITIATTHPLLLIVTLVILQFAFIDKVAQWHPIINQIKLSGIDCYCYL